MDMPGELSIELSWEEIHRVAEREIGFEILVSSVVTEKKIASQSVNFRKKCFSEMTHST